MSLTELTQWLNKHDLTSRQFYALLYYMSTDIPLEDTLEELWDTKGFFLKDVGRFIKLPRDVRKTRRLLQDLLQTQSTAYSNDLEEKAKALQEVYPSDICEYGAFSFRCNSKDIVERLVTLESVYGTYSKEEMIEATKLFVENHEEDYTYLPLLQNFIIKLDSFGDYSSTLISYIELLHEKENSQRRSYCKL